MASFQCLHWADEQFGPTGTHTRRGITPGDALTQNTQAVEHVELDFFLESDGKMYKLSGNLSASPGTTHATGEGRDAHLAKPVEELKGTFKMQVWDKNTRGEDRSSSAFVLWKLKMLRTDSTCKKLHRR